MPIVLKIMKYMETQRPYIEQTKAVIGKIDEAINVMVELRSLMNYDLSYEHSCSWGYRFRYRIQDREMWR